MHLTLNLGTSYKTGLFVVLYDFVFDIIMCVLVRIKVRGHLVMSIKQFMNLISVHFWTYATQGTNLPLCHDSVQLELLVVIFL